MKKRIFYFLLVFSCLISTTSCITDTYAQTTIGDDDVQLVIRYGTPYYYNNTLAYYYYNGYYFYPYWYNNAWRYHRYSRPLPPSRYYDYHRPSSHHHHGRTNYNDRGKTFNHSNHYNSGRTFGNGRFTHRPSSTFGQNHSGRSGFGGGSRSGGGHFGNRR